MVNATLEALVVDDKDEMSSFEIGFLVLFTLAVIISVVAVVKMYSFKSGYATVRQVETPVIGLPRASVDQTRSLEKRI